MMSLQLFGSSGMRIALAIGFAFMVGWYGTCSSAASTLSSSSGCQLPAGLAFLPSALFAVVGSAQRTSHQQVRHPRPNCCRPVLNGWGTRRDGAYRTARIAAAHHTVDHPDRRRRLARHASDHRPGICQRGARAGRHRQRGFDTFRQIGGAVTIAIFGALIADRTHFIASLQSSLTIAAVLLLAIVAISVSIRPTDHLRRLSSNQPKEKH